MQNRSPILLATIILGLLAVGGVAFMFLQPSAPPPQPVAAVPTPTPVPSSIYVANRDIPPRTIVTSAMLRKSTVNGPAPTDAIKSLDDIRGQITKEPIRFGETVMLGSFTTRIARQIPANFEIPSGYRAVAIWVDPKQTAAGLVDVGDRIDVIATHRLKIDKAPKQFVIGALEYSAGRLIAKNLLVLAVDKSIDAPAPTPTPVPGAAPIDPAAGPAPAPTPAPQAPGAAQPNQPTNIRVLLAAPPEIASRLVSANDMGTLHVTIRNPVDADAADVPETREYPSRTFIDNSSNQSGGGKVETVTTIPPLPPVISEPPVPMPVPPTTTPDTTVPADDGKEITVIRGTEKTRVIVPQR